MAAPKIKIYKLPAGYTADNDTDVREMSDDEPVPVKDKPITPDEWVSLTGVNWLTNDVLAPIDISTGELTSVLSPDLGLSQTPATGHTNILVTTNATYQAKVIVTATLDDYTGDYTVTTSGVTFPEAPPTGLSLVYWRSETSPTTEYISSNNDLYSGTNISFREFFENSGGQVDRDDYTVTAPSGLFTFDSSTATPSGYVVYNDSVSKNFISEYENWVNEHLYMSPDIFKGTFDYPGDDSEDSGGDPIVQGAIPEFVDSSEYQIDYRRGLVIFVTEVDEATDPVKAGFAHLVSVRNATAQVLDEIDTEPYIYSPVSDLQFPESIDARWSKRDDQYTPINIYVDGELKPQLLTVSPYDTLTVRT
jgi:hypothetical protein